MSALAPTPNNSPLVTPSTKLQKLSALRREISSLRLQAAKALVQRAQQVAR